MFLVQAECDVGRGISTGMLVCGSPCLVQAECDVDRVAVLGCWCVVPRGNTGFKPFKAALHNVNEHYCVCIKHAVGVR